MILRDEQRGFLGPRRTTQTQTFAGDITNIKKNKPYSSVISAGFELRRAWSVPNVGTGGVYSGPARQWLDSEAIV